MANHQTIINRVTRDRLKPLGLVQKGRSRVWLDDQGWWLGVVELQPRSGSRATALNVSVHWLWSESGHLSFDEPFVGTARRGAFVEYQSDAQFEPAVVDFVDDAAAQIVTFRDNLASLATACERMGASYRARSGSGPNRSWPTFHMAVMTALAGDLAGAHALFGELVAANRGATIAWQVAMSDRARDLQALTVLGDGHARFVSALEAAIHVQRAALKLPPLGAVPWPPPG